jgi:hypothetical protein
LVAYNALLLSRGRVEHKDSPEEFSVEVLEN